MSDNIIPKNLALWIAASESWSTFMDFQLPKENIAKYPFLRRTDDFYISLFGKLFRIICSENLDQINSAELLSLARSLEIFSLDKTKKEFWGINEKENMLYASSLYYLADFSASACFLARKLQENDFDNIINSFLSLFLGRKIDIFNLYSNKLRIFLDNGTEESLNDLIIDFKVNAEKNYYSDIDLFVSYRLAYFLMKKFKENNVWSLLLEQKNDILFWKDFILKDLFNRYIPVWDLFPSQKDALIRGILSNNGSASLRMPTSAGKTAIAELLIFYNHKINPVDKILFLAPFRALASELKNNFVSRLSSVGIKSKVMYGGSSAAIDETVDIENVDLLISTPEKFLSVESILPGILDKFNAIICDEGHLLEDEQRGLNYELLLSRFKSDPSEGKRFFFLSAIVPNLANINEWLGGSSETFITSDYRPTDIDYAFLNKQYGSYDLNVNPTFSRPKNYQLNKFITREDFEYADPVLGRKKIYKHTSNKTISAVVALKSVVVGPVALFSAQKGGTMGVVALGEEMINLLNHLPLPNPYVFSKNKQKIIELSQYINFIFGDDFLLSKLINFGVAYHHGDLPQFIREVIEDSFRDGSLQLVICTNTLAEGVNLPIKVMVVHSIRRYGYVGRLVNIPFRDIRNVVGRVGRAGQETKGFVIFTNENEYKIIKDVINDVSQEPIKGQLYRIIYAIDTFAKKNNIDLNNDIIEIQPEGFKELIDKIDVSILSLVNEELEVNDFDGIINSLAEKTFAYYQSTESEKIVLKNLFLLRGHYLKPFIEDGKLAEIKTSGATPRLYNNIIEKFDFDLEIWENLNHPAEDAWINYFLDIIVEFPQIKTSIDNLHINGDIVKMIIKFWINGEWYKEISLATGIEVEILLKIMNKLIQYDIQIISTNVINIAKQKLQQQEKILSEHIEHWPMYLLKGLQDKVELDLSNLGFQGRTEILALRGWLVHNAFSYSHKYELRDFLLAFKDQIVKDLGSLIPKLSLDNIVKNFNYLNDQNIFF